MFVTFAVTGGIPIASSAGNVTSVPAPTTAFIPPAVNPAARITAASRGVTRLSLPEPAPAATHRPGAPGGAETAGRSQPGAACPLACAA